MGNTTSHYVIKTYRMHWESTIFAMLWWLQMNPYSIATLLAVNSTLSRDAVNWTFDILITINKIYQFEGQYGKLEHIRWFSVLQLTKKLLPDEYMASSFQTTVDIGRNIRPLFHIFKSNSQLNQPKYHFFSAISIFYCFQNCFLACVWNEIKDEDN